MRATTGFLLIALGACERPAVQLIPMRRDVRHDLSLPLRDLPPAPALLDDGDERDSSERSRWHRRLGGSRESALDTVRQDFRVAGNALQLATSFEGIGWNFPAPPPANVWRGTWNPADPNGDVGPRHFVQVTNGGFVIFDKTGTVVYGPAFLRTMYNGFGGKCETDAEADPTVRYDALADRWLISHQTNGTPPNVQCASVSASGDPTGQYARYEFDYQGSPDFTKFAVWPDAYYITHNGLPNQTICALDRSAMLMGAAAGQQCFPSPIAGTSVALAADLEGNSTPAPGTPSIILAAETSDSPSALLAFRLHVDWSDASKSVLRGPLRIPISPVSNSFAGVPQPSTTQILLPQEGFPQNRLVYRNFGDHESIVGSLGARSGGVLGVRWFELRIINGDPALYQEGTYLPDSDNRFVGSAAMDASGGIALAYSISSPTTYPGARFTGRAASDPPGVMTQPEGILVSGEASQEHSVRWGDYGNLAVDPTDGCTFWYSAVYMRADSNASTYNFTQEYSRIGSFQLPSCSKQVQSNDFQLAIDSPTHTASAGESVTFGIASRVSSGQAEPLQLMVDHLPPGVTAQFANATIQSDSGTTLTVKTNQTVTGTVPIVVRASGSKATHDTSATLVIQPSAPPGGSGCSTRSSDSLCCPIALAAFYLIRRRSAAAGRMSRSARPGSAQR